jgi:dipeptidyl aminopeptidase/acylaminoacyl peptidase
MARPFDAAALALTGQPVQVARKVAISSANDAAFAVSHAGVLVYSEHVGSPGQLTWFDREGQEAGTVASVDEYLGVRLSPDAKTIAVTRVDPAVNMTDLWMLDVDRGVVSRFTADPWLDVSPAWSPDGGRVFFSSSRLGRLQFYQRRAGGATAEQLLARTAFSVYPDDVTKDGQYLIYSTDLSSGRFDIGLLRLSDLQTSPLVATQFNESQARLSPDSRWMAYTSDETGRDDILVREFPGGTASVQVSSHGGTEPAWRGDGRELYFLSPDDDIMSVQVNPTGPRLEVGAPVRLFQARMAGARLPYLTHYAASADGRRFLVNAATGVSTTPTISVVANWTSLAER